MENDQTLAEANIAIDQRIAAKEAQLAQLQAQREQLSQLAAEEDAFVQRLRSFVEEAEVERKRLQLEFQRLVVAR